MTQPQAPAISQNETPQRAAGTVESVLRDDFDRDVWCLMGLAVDAADITQAVASVDDAVRTRRRLSFVTPNVNFLVRAMQSPEARQEILNADLSLADGAPLIAMAKMLGVPLPSRVAGSDLFEALRRRPAFTGRRIRVFFFGGRDGSAEAAVEAINRQKGGVEAVGYFNPGFGDVESMSTDAIIEQVNAADADFVVVALGAAKGQAWIERNRERLNAPVTAHLGAVVDFTAEVVERAPEWMQRAGLEWLWRIKEEPALWKRYYKDGFSLAGMALTKLLPQWRRGRGGNGETARARIEAASTETRIFLSGDLLRPNLEPLRDAFREAAKREKPVNIDFSAAGAVDRAFLGLLLMLEKHQHRADAALRIAGVSPDMKALMQANHMNYEIAAPALAPDMEIRSSGRAAV